MSSTAQDSTIPAPSQTSQDEEKIVRARARRRAWICPGAGWALLGYPRRGAVVLLAVAICLAAAIWLELTLSPASIWTAGIAFLLAAALWTAELLDTGWRLMRSPAENPLARRFALATIVVWSAGLAIPLLVPLRFGSIEISDDRMAPTLEPGERLIYHRRVAERDLRQGAVIVYRLPPEVEGAAPGQLAITRILAAPGDELTVQGGHYLVNGDVTRHRAALAAAKSPLRAPTYPKTLRVPKQSYFVVQDSSTTGIDSQQLGWARRDDIVSARLFHIGGRGLRPVE